MAFGNKPTSPIPRKPLLDDDPFEGQESEPSTYVDSEVPSVSSMVAKNREARGKLREEEEKPCIPSILPIFSKEELKKRVSHIKGISLGELLNPPIGSNLEKLPREYISRWTNYQAPEDQQRIQAKQNFSKKVAEIEQPKKREEVVQQLLGFGKFADKTYEYVYERHRYYYDWACREVSGFRAKAEKFIKKS